MLWLWFPLGSLVVLVFLLAVPLELRFALETGRRARVRLVWGFGLIRFDLSNSNSEPKPQGPKKPQSAKKRGGSDGARRMRRMLLEPGVPRALARLVGGCISALRVRRLRADARLGADDPCETGTLYGFACAAVAVLPASPRNQIRITPAFEEPGLSGTCRGCLQVVPLSVVATALKFVLSPPVIRGALGS